MERNRQLVPRNLFEYYLIAVIVLNIEICKLPDELKCRRAGLNRFELVCRYLHVFLRLLLGGGDAMPSSSSEDEESSDTDTIEGRSPSEASTLRGLSLFSITYPLGTLGIHDGKNTFSL